MRQFFSIVLLGQYLTPAAGVDNGLGLYATCLRVDIARLYTGICILDPAYRAAKANGAAQSDAPMRAACQLAANGLAQLVVNVWRRRSGEDAALFHEDG
eukprot:COSAG02_NODE_9781_length_2111_cov_274.793213_1_plen_99_part_00